MSKRRGFVSPRRAARMLGVHSNTIYSWCQEGRFQSAERDPINGYLYISLTEILDLKEKRSKDPEFYT